MDMSSQTILIIDDDVAVRTSLELIMKQAGFLALSASSPPEALDALKNRSPELIIMDMNYSVETSGEEGLKLLKDIKKESPHVPVILITAKPWDNDHLLQAVHTALAISSDKKLSAVTKPERKKLDKIYNLKNLVGEDPEFLSILDTIGKISSTDASVLIIGESGTGKELIAEAIHNNSPRRSQPFVKVNLGGIPSTLFESEMFGHKKGAFTDARHDRLGRFEMAHTGSIFLDEIGDLSLNDQVKLLRVLQDRKFEILGSSVTKSVDIRVISATNRDLSEMVSAGDFREDLYYRINLITVKLPALRERPDDIPLLIDHFLNNLKTTYKRPGLTINAGALDWLKSLPWPGNIRELKNLIERTVLVTNKNSLDIENFSKHYQVHRQKPSSKNLPPVGSATLDEMEISLITQALKFHENNISKAAKSLGLSRSALYRRMEKHGLDK
jgi:DNA-binding NtrC family response regulator